NGRAHRLKVIWSNTRSHRLRRVLTAFDGPAFNENLIAVVVETKWDVARDRGRFDIGQRLQAFLQLPIELLSSRFVIPLQSEIKRHREGILRVEARVHRLQLLKRANDEPGSNEYH